MESKMLFKIMKNVKPRIDARRRNINFLGDHRWSANAKMKAIAASQVSSILCGLSSMPMMMEAIAGKTPIGRKIGILVLL